MNIGFHENTYANAAEQSNTVSRSSSPPYFSEQTLNYAGGKKLMLRCTQLQVANDSSIFAIP